MDVFFVEIDNNIIIFLHRLINYITLHIKTTTKYSNVTCFGRLTSVRFRYNFIFN